MTQSQAVQPVDHDLYRQYEIDLRAHLERFYGDTLGLDTLDVERAIEKRLSRVRGESLAALLDEIVGLADRRVLDVGSGWGELVLAALQRGADGVGIEPDREEVRISELLLASFGYPPRVTSGKGEALPWDDGSFDLVTCQQVLEHVENVEAVVRELVRVTRPGGKIFVSTPNYLFPYEGHYRMKWIPFTPKWLGSRILQLRGKDPTFLVEHVNYVTYRKLSSLWRRHRLGARNLTDELLRSGRHPAHIYERPLVRRAAMRFKLYPNVSWLLEKP